MRKLDAAIKERQKEERRGMLGKGKVKATRKKVKKGRKKRKVAERPLRGVFPGGKVLYATYKGKDYKAWVGSRGRIKYNGKLYDSPSSAGKAIITKGAVNGWHFWKYKDKSGKLVKITGLRK